MQALPCRWAPNSEHWFSSAASLQSTVRRPWSGAVARLLVLSSAFSGTEPPQGMSAAASDSLAAARRAAANCYCQLLASQSDNNVKLIVLDRLQVRI